MALALTQGFFLKIRFNKVLNFWLFRLSHVCDSLFFYFFVIFYLFYKTGSYGCHLVAFKLLTSC